MVNVVLGLKHVDQHSRITALRRTVSYPQVPAIGDICEGFKVEFGAYYRDGEPAWVPLGHARDPYTLEGLLERGWEIDEELSTD